MKLRGGAAHLTYCTNIHPGETWAEVRANLAHQVVAVKRQLAPAGPFGVGLRLSGAAAAELRQPAALADLQALLAKHDLYVFTVNAFPHGTFHGTAVKEAVYRPDWLEPERVRYTEDVAEVLAALLASAPAGIDGAEGCRDPSARCPGASGRGRQVRARPWRWPGRWRRRPRRCGADARRAARSWRWRWSPSRSACWRRRTTACASSRSTCSAARGWPGSARTPA